METLTDAENEALAARLSLSEPELWKGGFGYDADAGGWRVERHPRFAADVNGDMRDDIVGFGTAGIWVHVSDGSLLGRGKLWSTSFGYKAGGWRVERHPRLLADVNGDGRADVVGFADDGVYVSLSTGTLFREPSLWLAQYGYDAGDWRVERHLRFVTDVDGDSRADIVGFGDAGVYVSLSTGSGFTNPVLWVADYGYDAGWRVARHPRLLADVDADGRPDIIGFRSAGTYVSLSDGRSFRKATLWVRGFRDGPEWNVASHPRFAADVNADGHADIVGFGEAGVYVALSTGRGFSRPRRWVSDFGNAKGWQVDRHPRLVRDIDGDGRADIVGFGDDGAYISYSNGNGFSAPALAIDFYGYDAGDWRVEDHPRMLAQMDLDGHPDIVGFGRAGTYISTNLTRLVPP